MNKGLVKKLYRQKDYDKIDEKILSLGDDAVFETLTFCIPYLAA